MIQPLTAGTSMATLPSKVNQMPACIHALATMMFFHMLLACLLASTMMKNDTMIKVMLATDMLSKTY